jgi:type II secretory pathway pseudopilin PulG
MRTDPRRLQRHIQPALRVARRKSEAGVTLIELVIAITLVAALSLGMLMAMRTSLVTLEKVDNRLQFNRRVMSVQEILVREIGGVIPVVGQCTVGSGSSANRVVFQGNQQTLRLVSSYSLAEGARGYPRIIEFQVMPAEGGGMRLVMNEHPYTGPASTAPFCFNMLPVPAQVTPSSFIVADQLARCSISYHQVNRDAPREGNWVPVWNEVNLPSAVHIDMAPLAPDAAQLPLLSITVPIHVTLDVQVPYVDTSF